MPTLNRQEALPAPYNAAFRYHDSRVPSDEMVFQLADALQLARVMSRSASARVTGVLNGDVTPARADLVRDVLRHHLRADVDSPPRVQKKVASVLEKTADGLAGHVQLSDVLSRYMWDLYAVYVDGQSWQDARAELTGEYREDNPDRPRGGYVEEMTYDEVFVNTTRQRRLTGSIHIEFSYADVYPRPFLALAILHESTHKFAATNDYATTDDDTYPRLTQNQRLRNADSYAYTMFSLAGNALIPDLETVLQVLPRQDPTPPARFVRGPARRV